jgi:hypothetical protein
VKLVRLLVVSCVDGGSGAAGKTGFRAPQDCRGSRPWFRAFVLCPRPRTPLPAVLLTDNGKARCRTRAPVREGPRQHMASGARPPVIGPEP